MFLFCYLLGLRWARILPASPTCISPSMYPSLSILISYSTIRIHFYLITTQHLRNMATLNVDV